MLTPSEAKKLLKEFTRAQRSEMAALKHRNKLEQREMRASLSARHKEWERNEREARHRFFAENKKGPARRAYIQDYLSRRKIFLQLQSDEKSQRLNSDNVRVESLKAEQAQKLKEFQSSLERGERPPSHLWPSGG